MKPSRPRFVYVHTHNDLTLSSVEELFEGNSHWNWKHLIIQVVSITTETAETSYNVTDLSPFTVYSFKVTAVNSIGPSNESLASYHMQVSVISWCSCTNIFYLSKYFLIMLPSSDGAGGPQRQAHHHRRPQHQVTSRNFLNFPRFPGI